MAAIGIGWMRFGGPTGRPAKRAESDVRLLAASCGWFRAACLVREGFHGGSHAYVLPFGASLKPLRSENLGRPDGAASQNGLTTARMTTPIISSVGTSFTMRQYRCGFVLASAAKRFTCRAR